MTRRSENRREAAAEHRRFRELLGSYALGHLPRTQTAAVRAHLDGCPDCRSELAEIAPLADELRSIHPDRLSTLVSPPPALAQRIHDAVADERRLHDRHLRERRLVSVAAAALAMLAVGAAGFVAGDRRSSDRPPSAQPFEQVDVRSDLPAVRVDAGVVPHTWGVEIKVLATGFEAGQSYSVTVLTEDGRQRSAGGFVGTGEREMRCNLNASVLRADATGFTVIDSAGRAVLSADLPDI